MVKLKKALTKGISGIKLTAMSQNQVAGWVYLYLMRNSIHREPFGFLEDLFVKEEFRRQGIGTKLLRLAIKEAKRRGCYKLVGNSRFRNQKARRLYERYGMKKWGAEFRIDLKRSPARR